MGAQSPQGKQERANKALAQNYGQPILGESGRVAFDNTDKTANLKAGYQYVLQADADCFFCLGGDTDLATTAANQSFIPAGGAVALTAHLATKLHVTRATVNGNLYYSAWDDVG